TSWFSKPLRDGSTRSALRSWTLKPHCNTSTTPICRLSLTVPTSRLPSMSEAADTLHRQFDRVTNRRRLLLLLLVVALLLSLLLDLQAGPAALSMGDVFSGLLRPDSLELRHRIILWEVRLPDALIALAVGAALGLAGIETQ